MSHERMQTDAVVQDQPDFMSAVMKMDNELHDEDVESMKFLCQGLAVGSKLKRVDAVHDLISLLMSTNKVKENDTFLLADLLQYIGRIDVLTQIGFDEKEVFFRRQQLGSSIQPFYVLLFQIAEELAMEDVKKATFAYGKVPRSQNISTGLDLFTVMVQHKAIDPQNVGLLKSIFNTLEREDLVELVDRYVETNGQSVMDDLVENFRRVMAFRGQNGGGLFPAQSQVPQGWRCHNGFGPSVQDIDVRPQTAGSSNFDSMENQAPSEPTAPPLSFPTMEAGNPSVSHTAQMNNGPQPQSLRGQNIPTLSEAPEGYDQFVIPWKVLDVLSRNIPDEYWPELSYRLGAPVYDTWSARTRTRHHKLAVLRKWLELPETQALSAEDTTIFLVKALAHAGPTLIAQEIAEDLGVDMNAQMQDSMSSESQGSVYDTNDVASSASAAAPASIEIERFQQGPARTRASSRGAEMRRASPYGGAVPMYRMDRNPRGICLIINNRDFYTEPGRQDAKKMVNREGTDVDRDKLSSTFHRLGFLVDVHNNFTDVQLVRIMHSVAEQNHTRFDCFVCCILTHGVQGSLYGTNGITVPIRDLTGPLRAQSCPSLAGKPKLFFLQACQGREKQGAHDIQQDCALEEDAPLGEVIPNESDFLLGYATVPGFVSYRSKTRGSWYITKLTEMLEKYAEDHDILDILTLVNFEVGKGDALIEGGHFKQSPAPMYSLRKKLIFGRLHS